jgi:hypothetical protein
MEGGEVNMGIIKTGVVIAGGAVIAVAVADLGWGNTASPVLPGFIGNMLTQNTDIFLILLAIVAIFVTVTYA